MEKKLIGELVFFYVPWVIVGYLFDALWPLLFLASFILLIWHLHNQIKMSRWLHEGRKATLHLHLVVGNLFLMRRTVCKKKT